LCKEANGLEGVDVKMPTKDEKRVLNQFLEWYETLSPDDRRIFEYMMGKSILRVTR
jgi:hypothetical protein